jgi:hypothetical protein
MSFAGFAQVSQVCPKQNLRNFEGISTPLRSHAKACSLMGFAGSIPGGEPEKKIH